MGASTEHQKTGGAGAKRASKLEAKARRKAASSSRSKSRGSSKRAGGNGKLWMMITGVALASAGIGYALNDPSQVKGMAGDLGHRLNAAGNAFTGMDDKPATQKKPKENPPKAASLVPPKALKALPPTPAVAKTPPAPAANTAKPAPKPVEPPLWSEQAEKDLFNALGRKDHEAFRKLLAQHHEILPMEPGLDQDILAAAVARGKLADAQFMLASGVPADRILATPVKPAYAALIENKTFSDAAKSEKNITLLMVAAAAGDARMVSYLQSQGARNRSTSPRKFTALDFSVSSGKAEAIQACLGRKPGDESSRILVSLKERTATFFQEGRIQERSWVSTGRDGHPTPVGRFVITQKHKDWTSTKYHVKMPYFLRLNNGAIGLHAGNVPPYPASHGCIRLPDEQARTFFQMADIGTIVDIVN